MHGDRDWSLVAAQYAATGRADLSLQSLAASLGIGLVQVHADGTVTWSDEAYRLHGRPRWRRVRTVEDALAGVTGTQASTVRAAYAGLLGEGPDAPVGYAAVPELGGPRPLTLRRLGPGLALVHRTSEAAEAAAPGAPEAAVVVLHPVADADEPTTDTGHDVRTPRADAVEETDDLGRSAGTEPADESAHLAGAVLAASPDLVVVYDVAHDSVVQVAGSSPAADDVLTHLRAGDFIRARVHPEDREAVLAWRRSLDTITAGEVLSTEARFLMDGTWRWQEIRALDFATDGPRHEVLFHIRDVHDRVEAVQRLTARERAFREVFDSSPVGLAVLDSDGRFRSVNDAFCRLVGRTQDTVTATSIEALLHPEDRGGRLRPEGGPTTAAELRLVRSDGAVIWVRMRSSDISQEDGERVLVSVEDVTSSKAHEDRLRHDALHDDLTGLPNRRLIEDRLQRALARSRRSGSPMAVYFIDLDGLKRVNDTHPWRHRAGDVLITSVADALLASLRDTDTLGRLGGDEFVAICEDVADRAMVDEIGERLLDALRAPIVIGEEPVRAAVSVGVATPEDPDETPMQLLSRADAAMYRAKRSGGSRVVSADTLPPTAAALEAALEEGLLRLDYRPVASLATGALLGVEARIRWTTDAGTATAEELHAALETGPAMLPVVEWAVGRAVADVRTVAPTRTDHLSVWLALPCRAALAGATRAAFEAAFAGPWGDLDAGSAPSIVVDVAEDELTSVVRRDSLHRHLDDLVAVGPVSVGIDRFSAEALPLGLMRSLAIASVTLQPALLGRAAGEQVDRDLVRSLVSAAGALGVVTVADEVDSPADLEVCRGLGLHAVKGDLVGPYAPLETYTDLLHAGLVPLPDSFDARTHDELTGDLLGRTAAAPVGRVPEVRPAAEAVARDEDLAESELLSRDVLAAIRWLDELDRTVEERVQAAESSPDADADAESAPPQSQATQGVAPLSTATTAAPPTPTAAAPAGPSSPGASVGPSGAGASADDVPAPAAAEVPVPDSPAPAPAEPAAEVPVLAPLEPAPPALRMPGLDRAGRAADGPPPPWPAYAGEQGATEPSAVPDSGSQPSVAGPAVLADPGAGAEHPDPAGPASATPGTLGTPGTPDAHGTPDAQEVVATDAVDEADDGLVIELRDRPSDIGAALAAELGVDLTPFDRVDAPVGAGRTEPEPGSPATPAAGGSPFAGMPLPPSPFLRLRPED